jgi:hypothetical protein
MSNIKPEKIANKKKITIKFGDLVWARLTYDRYHMGEHNKR